MHNPVQGVHRPGENGHGILAGADAASLDIGKQPGAQNGGLG